LPRQSILEKFSYLLLEDPFLQGVSIGHTRVTSCGYTSRATSAEFDPTNRAVRLSGGDSRAHALTSRDFTLTRKWARVLIASTVTD
jgi:hypothetical protein